LTVMEEPATSGREIPSPGPAVRIEVYGEELISKRVGGNHKVGRIYLPLQWVGKRIKIILVD
jgi:hypothetical protein